MALDLIRPGTGAGATVASNAAIGTAIIADAADDVTRMRVGTYTYPSGTFFVYDETDAAGTTVRHWQDNENLDAAPVTTEPVGTAVQQIDGPLQKSNRFQQIVANTAGTTNIATCLRCTVFNDTDVIVACDGVDIPANGGALPFEPADGFEQEAFDIVVPAGATVGTVLVIGHRAI